MAVALQVAVQTLQVPILSRRVPLETLDLEEEEVPGTEAGPF